MGLLPKKSPTCRRFGLEKLFQSMSTVRYPTIGRVIVVRVIETHLHVVTLETHHILPYITVGSISLGLLYRYPSINGYTDASVHKSTQRVGQPYESILEAETCTLQFFRVSEPLFSFRLPRSYEHVRSIWSGGPGVDITSPVVTTVASANSEEYVHTCKLIKLNLKMFLFSISLWLFDSTQIRHHVML